MTAAPGPGRPGGGVPALEAAWSGLAAELGGDHAAVARFGAAWVELLATRVAALDLAVADRDQDGARDVLLSFRCTSAMLGVLGLEGAADRALVALDQAGTDDARRHLALVCAEARAAALLVTSTLAQGRWSNR